MTYYTNDKGDIAKVEQENYAKDLVKISVNGVFIDEWRKYDDFVKEFRGMGVKNG
ncbi:Uncharacterised protein [Moraxella lacunata]|uniref:Uncharacterized protein n=1 Tax=Moraxella lacunata TaxID=477 RepID=A0A378T6N7_MORLA|nr:hypothetical protein [Moraxella lacunata]STZ55563.1 Uncharacterised protein [Moraxella lacunata]